MIGSNPTRIKHPEIFPQEKS